MQQKHPNPLTSLLTKFTQTLTSPTPQQTQLNLLTTIKTIIMTNPNNYHHQYYGRATFVEVYQFVIECLSYQYSQNVLRLLLYVLAVMVKYWVQNIEEFKNLYEGILSLFQQRMYCGENCFRFFRVLVETMQESYYNHAVNNNNSSNSINTINLHNTTLYKYSMMPAIRTNIENYFIYHILNEMLAFSNIFLDKCVIRNAKEQFNSEKKGTRNSQDSSRMRSSRTSSNTFDRPYKFSGEGHLQENLSDEISSSQQQHQHQLYTLCQPQPIILSILSLIRVCLSYDFSHTSRYHQQSEYQPTKSPIILPTKYSKYSRFGQYDIFLKNQNTTQMLNYLYLISTNVNIKLQVLQILKSMSRIHFRYFKNKTFHKLHLQDIGYVIYNLLKGLDLNQPMSACINGNIKTTSMDRRSKVSIGILLGQIVSILFYHQPTFYLAELTLIQWLFEKVQVFIIEELMDDDYFVVNRCRYGNNCNFNKNKSLSKQDLSLLIQNFIGELPKLADYCKIYLRSNQQILEKVNQIYIKIGQKYYEMLCLSITDDPQRIIRNHNKYAPDRTCVYQGSILERSGQEESSKKFMNIQEKQVNVDNTNKINITQQDKQQTQTNIIPITKTTIQNNNNQSQQQQLTINNNTNNLILNKEPNYNYIQFQQQQPQYCQKKICFILALVRQAGSIHCIRNLLNIFRVYCPHHTHIDAIHNNIQPTSSNLSYTDTKISNTNTKSPTTPTTPPIPPKNTYKAGNYQKWMISWLCNFQNHFQITAGHSRQPQKWQIQLHHQMILQLLNDYQNSISIYQHYTIQKQYHHNQHNQHNTHNTATTTIASIHEYQQYMQLNQCILVITLYVCDKIMYDCRIPIQEYVQFVGLDLLVVVEWLCCNIVGRRNTINSSIANRIKNKYKNKYNVSQYYNNFNVCFQIQFDPIVQLLNNINYHSYFNNYNKNKKQQQWKLELFYRCMQNLHGFVHKISAMYALDKYEGEGDGEYSISQDTVGIYARILYLLLKNYLQTKQLYNQHYNTTYQHPNPQKHKQILTSLSKIFQVSPITLHILLQQLSNQATQFKYKKQLSQLYVEIIRKECVQGGYGGVCYGYFYRFLENGNQDYCWGNLGVMLRCLGMYVELGKKIGGGVTGDITGIVVVYVQAIVKFIKKYRQNIHNCSCNQLLLPLLKLLHQTNPSKKPHIHIHIITLLKQIHHHSPFLQTLQLPQLSTLLTLYLTLSNIFNTADSIVNQLDNCQQNNDENMGIFVVECCLWLMDLLSNVRKMYQCANGDIVRLEQQIVQFVTVGYGDIYEKYRYYGVLYHLGQVLANYKNNNQQNQQLSHIKSSLQHNLQHLLTRTLYFILSKSTQTIYIFPHTNFHPNIKIQQHQSVKVDNMIIVFTLYHQLLQTLWKKHEDIFRKLIENKIILDSLEYLGEKGVGWVVRKLEEWNVVIHRPDSQNVDVDAERNSLEGFHTIGKVDSKQEIDYTPDEDGQQCGQQALIEFMHTPQNKNGGNTHQDIQNQEQDIKKAQDNCQSPQKLQKLLNQYKQDSSSCPTAPFQIVYTPDAGNNNQQRIQPDFNRNQDNYSVQHGQNPQIQSKDLDQCKQQQKNFASPPNSCKVATTDQNCLLSTKKSNSRKSKKYLERENQDH